MVNAQTTPNSWFVAFHHLVHVLRVVVSSGRSLELVSLRGVVAFVSSFFFLSESGGGDASGIDVFTTFVLFLLWWHFWFILLVFATSFFSFFIGCLGLEPQGAHSLHTNTIGEGHSTTECVNHPNGLRTENLV